LTRGGHRKKTLRTMRIPSHPTTHLSARELQVLRLVAGAASNKHIARELGLSVHTVKRHVARLMAKLGTGSRAEAAALYRSMHPLEPRPVAQLAPAPEGFTARERDVMALVAMGESNMQIAQRLAVSVNTVKHHTANILGKLGVTSRIEAAAVAQAQLGVSA
jgi:DNA-binding NarL/FixJ family response regulator